MPTAADSLPNDTRDGSAPRTGSQSKDRTASLTTKPWLGYLRVSHVGEREGDSFRSVADQAEGMRAWAERRGEAIELLDPELNESGGRADRPILIGAVERIERGEARGLVVAYLSRAGRNVRHLLELWERIERAGGEIHAVAEGIDTSTAAGRLTRTMLAAIAEHELDVYRERFEFQRRSATERGIWQRRQTPLGYRRDETTRRLIPDDNAAAVVEAFRARAAGASLSELAARLGMTRQGARGLIRNRVYLGELRVGSHVNPDAHPPLVSEDLWLAAQYAQSSRPPRSPTATAPALLAGLVRCAGCGHVMSRSSQRRSVVYACQRSSSAGPCPAPAAITLRLLDQHVEAIALAELAALRASATLPDAEIDAMRARLRATEQELSAYLQAVSVSDVGAEAFAEGARTRRAAVEDAQARLRAVLEQSPARVDGDPVAQWTKLDGSQRNRLLRGLLEAVIVARAGGRGRIVPIATRVRVLRHGAGVIARYAGDGTTYGIRPVDIADLDGPDVLGM